MKFKESFRQSLGSAISSIFGAGKRREEILEDIEEQLVLADVSLDVAQRIVKELFRNLKANAEKGEYLGKIKEEFLSILTDETVSHPLLSAKEIVLLVGVNGSGKTTTAAKLAKYYQKRGRKVLLCAADTFRAAGSLQLGLWGRRLNISVIEGERGTDAGAVIYMGIQKLTGGDDFDFMIVDTAGRVQNQDNLMRELEKLVHIIQKHPSVTLRETLLVLDGTTGNNALVQAEKFKAFSRISGLVLAKMDGTAKGGMVISIADRFSLPVRFVGVGEGENDLEEFSPSAFIDALLAT